MYTYLVSVGLVMGLKEEAGVAVTQKQVQSRLDTIEVGSRLKNVQLSPTIPKKLTGPVRQYPIFDSQQGND
jgi:hypothetical protein